MAARPEPWSDWDTEQTVGILLRWGVTASAIVVLIGGVLYLLHYGSGAPHHATFRGEPADLRTVTGIARDAFSGRSRGIIQFGLLMLIATPIARVVFSVYAFIQERDWLYVGITLIVLAVLAYSLVSGYIGI